MSSLIAICTWIYQLLKRFVLSVVSTTGAIVAAISAFGTLIYTWVREFDESSTIIQWIDAATRGVGTIRQAIESSYGDLLLHMFAVDSAMSALITAIMATFGFLLTFVGVVLVGVVSLIPTVLTAQVIMKSIKVASGGFVDP